MIFSICVELENRLHFRRKGAQIRFYPVILSIYLIEGCKVFLTFSTGSTVKGRLRLAEKIVNETRLDSFFVIGVAS